MKRLLPLPFLFIGIKVDAQCGYPVTLKTTRDYCLGTTLVVGSTHTLEKIVWYKDGQPVSSVNAEQALSTHSVIVAGMGNMGIDFGDALNQLGDPSFLGSDEGGNLYVYDRTNNRILKFTPGNTTGQLLPISPPGIFFVDKQGNTYVSDNTQTIQKWAPGATSGVTVGLSPNGAYTQWSGVYVDCQQNVYSIVGTDIIKYTPGNTSGIKVAGVPGAYAPANLHVDQNGNIFVVDVGNSRILEWKPGATDWTVVFAGKAQVNDPGTVGEIYGFWMDGQDTIYISDYQASTSGRVFKVGPGSSTPLPVAGGDSLLIDPSSLTMDIHGNLFVGNPASYHVLEYKRTSRIDSAFTPTVAGKYYAVVTDMQGYPVNSDTLVINGPQVAPASIQITATATSTPVCTPITFTATSANAGVAPSFQWEVSGVKVGDGSLTYSNYLFANGDKVYCVMNAQDGCTGTMTDTSNIITLDIDPHGTAAVTIEASKTAVCKGDPVSFSTVVTHGLATTTYEWLLNGVNTGAASDTFGSSNFANGDVITCIINSDNVCGLAKSNSVPLVVSDPPVVNAGQSFSVPYGQTITLEPVVTGDVATYAWTPTIGLSDSTIRDPAASPPYSTLYTLNVVAPGGCTASGTIYVEVYTPLSIPNAFTPNGDGHNDVFYVLGGPEGSEVEEFDVFSRWGEKVFGVHGAAPGDRSHGWDGSIHGRPAAPDTYVYIVSMSYPGGKKQVYKGTVILIR
jgi:gliding motility-associated-like protein